MKKIYYLIFIVSLLFLNLNYVSYWADSKFSVSSKSFENWWNIPSKYTCDWENINPQFSFSNIPSWTKSIVIIMDDPDADNFLHWTAWNIDPKSSISENDSSKNIFNQWINDFWQNWFWWSCPPSWIHNYNFKIYALDTKLSIKDWESLQNLKKQIENRILAQTSYSWKYWKDSSNKSSSNNTKSNSSTTNSSKSNSTKPNSTTNSSKSNSNTNSSKSSSTKSNSTTNSSKKTSTNSTSNSKK